MRAVASRELDDLVLQVKGPVYARAVLDARGENAYRRGHIPGSLPIDWRDWVVESPGFLAGLFENRRV